MAVLVAGPVWPAGPKTCRGMTQELAVLRNEYRNYVTGQPLSAGNPHHVSKDITFEGLAEILDKIVAVKNAMRKQNCKIPPRDIRLPQRPTP